MYRPKDVLEDLKISPATLRLWSNNFSDVLSPAAQRSTTEAGTAAQRRYSESDIQLLRTAKRHLHDGLTYEETLARLREQPPDETPPLSQTHQSEAVPNGVQLIEQHPVMMAFEQALRAKDETIEAKDQLITQLQSQIDYITSQRAPLAPVKFRWGLLNRLLIAEAHDVVQP